MVIIVPHRIIWSWYTGRSWVGCYIWYSEEGSGRGCSPPMPLLAVLNATAYPSAASVPIITLLYNGPLNCGFNVRIKGLKRDVCYKLIRLSFDCLKHSKSDRRSWVIINLINTHANVHRTPMTLSVGRSVTQSHRLALTKQLSVLSLSVNHAYSINKILTDSCGFSQCAILETISQDPLRLPFTIISIYFHKILEADEISLSATE